MCIFTIFGDRREGGSSLMLSPLHLWVTSSYQTQMLQFLRDEREKLTICWKECLINVIWGPLWLCGHCQSCLLVSYHLPSVDAVRGIEYWRREIVTALVWKLHRAGWWCRNHLDYDVSCVTLSLLMSIRKNPSPLTGWSASMAWVQITGFDEDQVPPGQLWQRAWQNTTTAIRHSSIFTINIFISIHLFALIWLF